MSGANTQLGGVDSHTPGEGSLVASGASPTGRIDVAVVPAAGRGTRMRPATRVVPKALLTVVDRPAIQFVVEEAAAAGVAEVILVLDPEVVGWVSKHFSIEGPLPGLEEITITTVAQDQPLGLGHAVNVAADLVGERNFFCLLSDRIPRPGHQVLRSLAGGVNRNDRSGSGDADNSVVYLRTLDQDHLLASHGVAVPASDLSGGYLDLAGAVEKPGVSAAPSRLGFDGRYLFTPEVFSVLDSVPPGVGGEIQLTDAINVLGAEGRLRGFVGVEDLLDVGTPEGLVEASSVLGAHLLGG